MKTEKKRKTENTEPEKDADASRLEKEEGAGKRRKKTAKEMKARRKELIASGVLQLNKERKKEPPEAATKEDTQQQGKSQGKSGARGKQQIAETGGDKKKEDAKQKKDKKTEHKRKSDSGGGGGEVARQPHAKKQKIGDDKSLVFPVLVRGLGEVSVADLQDVFSECGETAGIKISGHGKAIVTFVLREAAAMALKLHSTEMDGSVIKVSKLPPIESSAPAVPAGPVEPDDGMSLSVCINQVPLEATVEEIEAACDTLGAVGKVKIDKKRKNVAYCEFVSKVSARLAAKRGVRIGRVLCKVVHLKSETVQKEDLKMEAAAGEVVSKEKGASLTVLAKGLPDGVSPEEVREFFKECGEISDGKAVSLAVAKHVGIVSPTAAHHQGVCGTVKEVRLFMDKGTETFKGMCFVEFAEAEALNAALQMHGRDNDGRPMKIDWTDNKEVAVKKKYGSSATMNPKGLSEEAKKRTAKAGKTGKGGKGIPKHEGTSTKFE